MLEHTILAVAAILNYAQGVALLAVFVALPRVMHSSLGALLFACGALCLVFTSACLDNSCAQISDAAVRYTDGHTSQNGRYYQSSTVDEPFLRYPAARVFQMDHGLASAPSGWNVYLSFAANGKPQTEAAGNSASVVVTDEFIQVKNDTCADFFVRVEAWLAPDDQTASPSSPGTAITDAGVSDAETTPEGDAD